MAEYYLKVDNIMKNMFVVALKDELAAQAEQGNVQEQTEELLAKVRAYDLREKRLSITSEEQHQIRNALNRLRNKYLAMGRTSGGIDKIIMRVLKPNTSKHFFW